MRNILRQTTDVVSIVGGAIGTVAGARALLMLMPTPMLVLSAPAWGAVAAGSLAIAGGAYVARRLMDRQEQAPDADTVRDAA
jgi:hypothetical protein